MIVFELIALVLGVGAAVYLIVALITPERF